MCLLRELRRHGVGHQRWRVLLWSLCLGEGEWGMTSTSLCSNLSGSKLWGLEVALTTERSCLAVEVGLSITIVAASAEAIGAAIISPIASSILWICAKSFVWSIIITSTIIPVPKTTKITPSRGVSIPTVIVSTSASPWTTWKRRTNLRPGNSHLKIYIKIKKFRQKLDDFEIPICSLW